MRVLVGLVLCVVDLEGVSVSPFRVECARQTPGKGLGQAMITSQAIFRLKGLRAQASTGKINLFVVVAEE
jgi:hypothetical protein